VSLDTKGEKSSFFFFLYLIEMQVGTRYSILS
jgi:hypothetical protein